MQVKRSQSISVAIGLCAVASVVGAGSICPAAAQADRVLINNERIFDGTSDKFADNLSELVKGNEFAKIAQSIAAPDGAQMTARTRFNEDKTK